MRWRLSTREGSRLRRGGYDGEENLFPSCAQLLLGFPEMPIFLAEVSIGSREGGGNRFRRMSLLVSRLEGNMGPMQEG